MATWGDLNGPTNIYQRMTQPVNNPVAGRPPPGATPPAKQPTTLAEFLTQRAQQNQSQFNPAHSYLSTLSRNVPAQQSMHHIDDKSPLRVIQTLQKSNPFNLDAFHDSNGMLDETQFMSYNTIGDTPLFQKREDGSWMINPKGRYGELNNQFKGLDFRIEKDPYDEMKPKLIQHGCSDTNGSGSVPTYKFIFSPADAVADYNEGSVTWDATRVRHVSYYTGTLNDSTADTSWVVKGTLAWGDWGVTKPVTGTTWLFDARWNRKTIDSFGSVDLYNSDGGSFETVAGFGTLEFTDIDRHIKLTTP